jgi:hypothetical protein
LPFVYGDPDEGQHSGRTGVHQPYFWALYFGICITAMLLGFVQPHYWIP